MKNIIDVLEARKRSLSKIVNSNYPVDHQLKKAHENRVVNAKNYINELEQLILTLTRDSKIFVVAENTFENRIAKADFATIEDEGLFFRLANVINYPGESVTLLCLASLSTL